MNNRVYKQGKVYHKELGRELDLHRLNQHMKKSLNSLQGTATHWKNNSLLLHFSNVVMIELRKYNLRKIKHAPISLLFGKVKLITASFLVSVI